MLLLLINLGLLLYLIFNYILEKVEKLNPLKTKKQKAYQIAAHKLKKLHHKKEKDRSIQLYNILLEFLSNKTNHSFESKTMPQINELLKQKNLDSDLIEKTISMMEKLSYINYAPSTKDKADSDKIYQDVLDCIKLLNKNL